VTFAKNIRLKTKKFLRGVIPINEVGSEFLHEGAVKILGKQDALAISVQVNRYGPRCVTGRVKADNVFASDPQDFLRRMEFDVDGSRRESRLIPRGRCPLGISALERRRIKFMDTKLTTGSVSQKGGAADVIDMAMSENDPGQLGALKAQLLDIFINLIHTPSRSRVDQDQFFEIQEIDAPVTAVCHLRASDDVDAAMDFERSALISSQWAHGRVSFKPIFNFLKSFGVNFSH
jgi:hypothetical protein